ncbi:hypothetical protein HK405_013898, partial [Cladochytrium tenue]
MDWIYAKVAKNVMDDGNGGYGYKSRVPSLPVMFSNQCAAVLDVLRNPAPPRPPTPIEPAPASSPDPCIVPPPPFRNVTLDAGALLSRRIFDIATASAYVPEFPLRVFRLTAADDDVEWFVGLDREQDAQWAGRRGVLAASLCAEQCAFCCAAEAGEYTDLRGQDDGREHRYRCSWLLDKLVQRCSSGGGAGEDDGSADVLLFGVDVDSELEDITRHVYV